MKMAPSGTYSGCRFIDGASGSPFWSTLSDVSIRRSQLALRWRVGRAGRHGVNAGGELEALFASFVQPIPSLI